MTRHIPTPLRSSATFRWPTISVELQSHAISNRSIVVPLHMELTLAICSIEDGLVSWTGTGPRRQTIPITKTIPMTPIAMGDNKITVTAPFPKTLNVPTTLFTRSSDEFNLPEVPAHSIRYIADLEGELISQMGHTILPGMTSLLADGHMLVQSTPPLLVAQLLHRYRDSESSAPAGPVPHCHGHARLCRVLDYVSANIADNITIADLARVACLSKFHFARMFARAVGMSPHRYVSRMRLEKAMAEIVEAKLTLAQIALNARFSSQASFTRAFRRATGVTPGEYRRCRRITMG
jgi:AraC family transcriptional regulator